ncbi:MAG: hypothetical protein ISR77_21955 [Pirellulaceae bacterium]|nr:hypothetical protein [Pirellulaceae bacterium]
MALYRPHRAGQSVPNTAELARIDGGYILKADVSDGTVAETVNVATFAN